MAVPIYDFKVKQGSTAVVNYTLNDADGNPMDFTGLSVRGSIKLRHSDSTPIAVPLLTVNCNVVTLSLTSAQTTVMPVGMAIYDLEKYSTVYDSEAIMEGYIYISPEVTT